MKFLIILLSFASITSAWTIPRKSERRRCTFLYGGNAQSRHEKHLDFMGKDPGNTVGDSPDLTEDLELVKTIAKAADGRKADNIVALQVAHISTLASYFVFLSGNSRPQNQAIASAISDDVEEKFGYAGNPQGTADSGWMVLDYGSVMVHIMTPKSRLYYNVEGQWRSKGGVQVDISDILVPNKVDGATTLVETMQGLSEEEDPFWT